MSDIGISVNVDSNVIIARLGNSIGELTGRLAIAEAGNEQLQLMLTQRDQLIAQLMDPESPARQELQQTMDAARAAESNTVAEGLKDLVAPAAEVPPYEAPVVAEPEVDPGEPTVDDDDGLAPVIPLDDSPGEIIN